MTLNEVREYFKNRLRHAPNCYEEYRCALSALDELEAYRNTAQSPDDIIRMQERFYELSVERNTLKKELDELKGADRNETREKSDGKTDESDTCGKA